MRGFFRFKDDMKCKVLDNVIGKGVCWIWLEFYFEGIKMSLNSNWYISMYLGLKKFFV